jgi:hypothetical protein
MHHVTELASEVARAALSGRQIESVSVEPSVDSLGNDALRVTVVAQRAAADRLPGEVIVEFENTLRDRLEQLGDERLPIVDILTPEDLAADVSSES